MALLRDSPYIWVTWLTKLLAGENSCEWAAWFRSQHEGWSWERVPGAFDLVGWQLKHTARNQRKAASTGRNGDTRCSPRTRTASPSGARRPP